MELRPKESSAQGGFTLSWHNLSYKVKDKAGASRPILNNLQGIVKPGSVTAVLGAGKSSFLDVLAGRKPGGQVSGEVAINGRTDIPIKHASRYCTQEEALFGNLTVYETLLYAAHFNLPKDIPLQDKIATVYELLQEFGLVDVEGTIIGTPLKKGCSGGQVRSVSVASQIIGLKGGILFLDEPTSGLDSVAAASIITIISSLAEKENATIMATIHQPSSETFALFSHLLILGGGSTVYFGPRPDAIPYFESIGHPIPLHSNPSDVYLQLTNTDFVMDRQEGAERVEALAKAFDSSPDQSAILAQILSAKRSPAHYKPGSLGYVNGFRFQTKTLLSRALLNAAKNPLAYWIRVAMYLALALLMGTTWLRMGTDQSTVRDRLAGLFFAVAFLSFMSVAGIPAFLEERHVFLRESANGLYGAESYLLSNLLVSVPFIFIITISFSLVGYFMMGLQEGPGKFLTFVGYLFLSLMIAEAQTVFISVAIPIFVGALAVTAFTNGLWMVVQGFFVQKTNIPVGWRNTLHRIDFQKYSYELLIKNELEGLEFQCESGPSACACVIPPSHGNSRVCTFSGEDVLSFYEYSEISYRDWTLCLLAIFVFFKLATYVALKITTRRSGKGKSG